MRTFILKARNGTTAWQQVRAQIGNKGHFEVIAHSIINAFFVSNGFRTDTEFYVILDSSHDFPRTLKLSAVEGLSIAGFHEGAVIDLLEKALKDGKDLKKDETLIVAPGLEIHGFGFEKLVGELIKTRQLYLLEPKGDNLREQQLEADPIFILSDHLALPKNNVKSLKRRGLKTLSLGKKMLFASQCIVLLHHELDLQL
jgi:tRNA (pseudouridine54-N1)-methyltransferase